MREAKRSSNTDVSSHDGADIELGGGIASRLTSGEVVSGSVAWNLVGVGLPTLVGIAAVPILLRGLGTEKFGILTLYWALIGSLSLFDLGLGRALTQVVASTLAVPGSRDGVGRVAVTGLILMTIWGIAVGVALAFLAPTLVTNWLRVSDSIRPEAIASLRLLAVGIPTVVTSAGVRGLLEAFQQFRLSNLIRIPLGLVTFAGPVIILPFSHSLVAIVSILVVARIIALIAYFMASLRFIVLHRAITATQVRAALSLVRMGLWMSVSNILGPALVYADRFLISGLVSVSAVAYYAVPFDVLTRLLVIPSAIAGVTFPAFATSFASDQARTTKIFLFATKATAAVMFVLVLGVVAFGHQLLVYWVGPTFADHSGSILKWLAIGVLCNGVAQIPFSLLQGIGRADLTAKLHVAETLVYLPVLWVLVGHSGIEGAAFAWAIRVGADLLLLTGLSVALLKPPPRAIGQLGLAALVVVVCFAIGAETSRQWSAGFAVVSSVVFAALTWMWLFSDSDRRATLGLVSRWAVAVRSD